MYKLNAKGVAQIRKTLDADQVTRERVLMRNDGLFEFICEFVERGYNKTGDAVCEISEFDLGLEEWEDSIYKSVWVDDDGFDKVEKLK